MLKIYNTLTRKVEEFKPDNKNSPINLYTCGPTVYNFAHIGNFRSYLFADSIFRALKSHGHKVHWVMNLTDVDDKTIKGAVKEFGENATVKDLRAHTDKYIEIFLAELRQINIDSSQIEIIRVADVIPQIQEFILDLIKKGYAYQTEDGIFFNINKYQEDFKDYGELVGQSFLEGKKVGARVAVDEYEKENLSDFALWKAHTPEDAQIFWDHPTLGKGRPGWHIECSVINNVAFKGQPTDIHTGGVDLVFPHHTNEIAQSQPFYRRPAEALAKVGNPFSKFWMHCEHLQIDNKKMAKRDGNVFLLKDLAEKKSNNILAFRYLCLQTDFRKSMNFSWESLEAAGNALEKLKNKLASYATTAIPIHPSGKTEEGLTSHISRLNSNFTDAISNDLNFPQALAVLWEVVNDGELSNAEKYELITQFDQVLGLGLTDANQHTETPPPEDVLALASKRAEARESHDFEASDRLREQLEALGYTVKDTKSGSEIVKI